jgi:uncharacterized protein (DUF2336 family)
MTEGLSEKAIEALLDAAKPPEIAANRLGRSMAEAKLTAEERLIAEELLRRLVGHASVKVREAISETLQNSPHLPHDIAVRLIADVESVAVPVILFSPIVTNDDLIEVVRTGGEAKQIAVASRKEVPAIVAEALVDTDNSRAVATLVGNPGAALDASTLEKVAGRFGSDAVVTEILQKHPHLSSHIAERLRHFRALTLVEYLKRHPDLPEPVTTQMVLRTMEEMGTDLFAERMAGDNVQELVAYLCRAGRLSPSLILRALCTGDIELCETGMAALAGVPAENARVLIYDAGPRGFKSLYDKAGLPPKMLPAFRMALEILQETMAEGRAWDRKGFQRLVLERILSDPEHLDDADQDYLLVRLSTARH